MGKGLGTLVGGLIYNSLGAAMMYRCAVAWVVIGWVLQAVLGKAFAKRQQVENGAFK